MTHPSDLGAGATEHKRAVILHFSVCSHVVIRSIQKLSERFIIYHLYYGCPEEV